MKKFQPIRIIIALINIFMFSSCDKDWLDEKSDSKLSVPSTLQDFQALLDDTQCMNISESDKGEIASDGHYISDASFVNARLNENKDAYIWSKTTRHATGSGNSWAILYRKILYCNIVLDGMSKFDAMDIAQKKTIEDIKGQALFQRSFEFFQLAQLYTPPVFGEEMNSEFGLILRLDVDITIPSRRSTVLATYTQIIRDLKEAVSLLPDRPKILTRGSKVAALALLSRVYLYLGDYEEALRSSNECLNLYSRLLDYNFIPNNSKFIGIYNDEVLFHATFIPTSYLTTDCLIDSNLVNSYDMNDLRRRVYFQKNANGTYSFIGNYYKSNSPIFCGLAIDEIMLNRAEAYVRLGQVKEALSDLNALLVSRWKKDVSYPGVQSASPEVVLKIVLKERVKSLVLRGTRWMDLRRLNQDARFQTTISRTIDSRTYTLQPNSYQYAFPFPEDVIEQSGVNQNPGWEK